MSVIVLGMHRSGTSALTRIINLMGAYAGDERELLPPDTDNPRGFWERRDVIAVNRELLRASGCSWFHVHRWDENPATPPALIPPLQAVLARLAPHAPWVMKDPRLCLTLPHWLQHMPRPTVVVMYRDPREIAASLHRRNGMPPEYGLALWEQHAAHAIRASYGLPCVFARYDALLADPVAVAGGLLAGLQQTGLSLSPAPESAVRSFVEPQLKHALADSSLTLTPHQELLCAMLCGEAPMDSAIRTAPQSIKLLESMASSVSGARRNP